MKSTRKLPKTVDGARVSQPSATRNRFRLRPIFDVYLEVPVRTFRMYQIDTDIRGLRSTLYIINIFRLHFSIERFKQLQDLGGQTDEVFNETSSGDG